MGEKLIRNKRKLALKIAISIGIVVIVCMTIMVGVSAVLSRNYLETSIDSDFRTVAEKNGLIVQNILDEASNTAADLQSYIEDRYEDRAKTGYTGSTEKSDLYNVMLQEKNKEMEDYILHTAWATVSSSDFIEGIGVFFEQNKFDPAIKDYTIYVSESDAKNKTCQSYGSYSDYGSKDYYTEAKNTKDTVFTKPYEDQGITMVTASYPVIYNNEVQAVIVVDVNVANFSALESTSEEYPSMFAMVVMNDSTVIYDSVSAENTGLLLSEMIGSEQYGKIQAGVDTGKAFSVQTKRASGSVAARYYTPIDAEGQTWWAMSALNVSELYASSNSLMAFMIISGIISVIIIVFLAVMMISKFINPINKVVDASRQLTTGDFNIQIKSESNDEIGELSDAFSGAATTLREIIGDLKHMLGEMANSNFNVDTNVDYPGDFDSIKNSLAALSVDISRTLHEINIVSEGVAVNAENISQGAQSLTEGATEQASAIQELQSTITDVSAEVTSNAQGANEANEKAKMVGEDIVQTNERMQEIVKAMDVIDESAIKINTIINTINTIATQTNLLAINASIEAARAGEAGKGFAVVASQVGELAKQSATAAKDSTTYIEESMEAVKKGKDLVTLRQESLLPPLIKLRSL